MYDYSRKRSKAMIFTCSPADRCLDIQIEYLNMKIPTRPPESGDHVDRVIAEWTRERPTLDLSAVAVVARLGRATRYLDEALDRLFGEHGLNRGSFDVLASLRRAGPPYRRSPTELYRALMRTSGAMTHRLGKLEADGLIRRVPDAEDGRSVLVELTARGRRLVDAIAPAHLENERRLLEPLSQAERIALADLLRKLLLAFEQGQAAAGEDRGHGTPGSNR
jgi:DNA-binding MarR family transcriptional regulator